MKPVFLRILLVIQLATLALAGDQDELHDLGVCHLEDIALACQQLNTNRDVTEVCCHVLAAAIERGCFCWKSRESKETWNFFAGDFCTFETYPFRGVRCSEPRNPGPSSQVHQFIQEHVAPFAHSNTSSDIQSNDTGEQDEASAADYPGVIAAGFLGSFLVSCASCCKPKKKDDSKDPSKQDVSINSLSSHDNSRSIGGRSLNSSFSGFSTPGTHLPAHPGGGALTFTMAELMKVTGNFSPSHKIGQGGFGTVYKGKLRDGTVVAVKRAKRDAFEARLSVEFQTELDMLSQVDHLNLVKLIGYLEEQHERIIVVEYVSNGNLREHLDGAFGGVLDMATRLDISIDIAHALTYLHLYADRPIIHRDVKASNILLTDTWRAKVADFGFSRTGPTDQGATHVSTQVKGTAGYLDPEYLTTYQLNQKSDVYSFGILLLEIFTGRRPIELKRPSDERVTVRWAFKKFIEGKVMEILDPKLEKTPAIHMVMERLAELAFACSAPTKSDRPSMKKAQEALWNIRKEYRGQTSGDPGRSPSPMSRSTFTIKETDSRSSPSVQSPQLNSPNRSPQLNSPIRSPQLNSPVRSPLVNSPVRTSRPVSPSTVQTSTPASPSTVSAR